MLKSTKVNNFIRAVISTFAALSIIVASCIPTYAAMPGNTPEEQIYNFMKNECGIQNDAAIAGITAIIEQDSEFDPEMVAVDGETGEERYGLCLWTGKRLKKLKKFCEKNNFDWKSFEGQLRFIKNEWETDFTNVNRCMHNTPWNKDYNFPDSADGAECFGTYLRNQYVLCAFDGNDEGARARDYFYPRIKELSAQTAAAPAASSASQDSSTQESSVQVNESNEQHVYNFLVNTVGIKNKAAIAGIMASIEFDTGYDPKAVADDNYGTRKGICLWDETRYAQLVKFCKSNKMDPESLDGQLNFMLYEWNHNYKNVRKVMLNSVKNSEYNFPDTAEGAYSYAAFYSLQYSKFNNVIDGQTSSDKAQNETYQKVVKGFTASK